MGRARDALAPIPSPTVWMTRSVGILLFVFALWTPLAAQQVQIDPTEIITLLPKDTIPAVRDATPLLVSAQEVKGVRDTDQVLAVVIRGESRAYPIPFLSWHEVVNDTVGGVAIAATWSPVCYTGIIYAREIDGRIYSFGVSGKLWANGLIMYDHQTDSLWSHLAGQAITGPMTGTKLQMLPAIRTNWGTWKRLHPETLVIDPVKSPHQRDYSVDPYEGYYNSDDIGVLTTRRDDPRLHPKSILIGLRLHGVAKAYPFTRLSKQAVVNDTLANVPVVVVFRERYATGMVFSRRLGDRVLTFTSAPSGAGDSPRMRDEQTGSLWTGLEGVALEGPLEGQHLKAIPSTYAFWFAWKDYYPDTMVFGEEFPTHPR